MNDFGENNFNFKSLTLNGLIQNLQSDDALSLETLISDNPFLYEILETGLTVLRLEARLIKPDVKELLQKTYFIRSKISGFIKIGKSINPELRMKSISNISGMPLELLCIIDEDIETKLHNRFKEYRVHGEWFDDKDNLIMRYIMES